MIGKILCLDVNKKDDQKKIIEKITDPEFGWIYVILEIDKQEWKGKVLEISSKGIYKIQIEEKE